MMPTAGRTPEPGMNVNLPETPGLSGGDSGREGGAWSGASLASTKMRKGTGSPSSNAVTASTCVMFRPGRCAPG